MAEKGFAHLHVHTEYSMLDGAAKLKPLFAEAQRLGMPALAMTDHGNMHGAYSFQQVAHGTSVKPIIGIEAYVAPGDRREKAAIHWGRPNQKGDDVSGGGAYTHMTLLALNPRGLRNLFALTTEASATGFYRKPRVDRELLARYSEGVLATTGCPGGEIQTRLRLGQQAEALEAAGEFRDIFGENFYLELMDHGLLVERKARDGLLTLAKKLDLPLLATNDSHYVVKADAATHDALLCVQTSAKLTDIDRFRFDGDGYYLRSAEEMRGLFRELPDACDNTLLIAERVEPYDEVFTYANRMPHFPVPDGHTEETWLREEVRRGMEQRFPNGYSEEHRARMDFELDTINQMGFPGYLLVVADLLAYARANGIRYGPGRGSVAGCLCAYALGISGLDPIEHGLLFERFLNPERVTMPDADLDFDESRRGEMIRYASERWGTENVAQIAIFSMIKAKAAIRDSVRVQSFPYKVGDQISAALPSGVMGKDVSLAELFDPESPRYREGAGFRDLYEGDDSARKVVDLARCLEGTIRQTGVHPAGVIISSQPLAEVVPLSTRDKDGAVIAQFDMNACDALGLLKMDFLGLRNLTVLDGCLANIRANRGLDIVPEDLPMDDRKTFELLARGDTLGVFQLDGGAMRDLLRAVVPSKFSDIAAVIALYRPGPMGANAHNDYADCKNGRKPVVPIHPELAEPLAEILDETYGLIVYQEHVMAIAQKVAGYSLAKADLLRRAMGKKKKEILDKEFEPFEAGMKANGYSADTIKTLWDILVPFSDYAFNKSHAAGYGLLSYWTAYLKANYPAEYMAALLTSTSDDKAKSAVYLNECRRMGVKVLPPDVNASQVGFAPDGEDVRYGLLAVRNVGAGAVKAILKTREKKLFADFYDFLDRMPKAATNKKVVQGLIAAGAFDSLGHARAGLHDVSERVLKSVNGDKVKREAGQASLFDEVPEIDSSLLRPPIGTQEWDKADLLAAERNALGLYVSDHPLAGIEHVLVRHGDTPIATVIAGDTPDGARVRLAGMVASFERRTSKSGQMWGLVQLEDLDATVQVLVFSRVYPHVANLLAQDMVVVVEGRVQHRDRGRETEVSVVANEFHILTREELAVDRPSTCLIKVRAADVTADTVDALQRVLRDHPGSCPVQIVVGRRDGRREWLAVDRFPVDTANGLATALAGIGLSMEIV